jgi:hypothetical protein
MGGILQRRRGGDARLLTEYGVSRGQYWFLRIVSDKLPAQIKVQKLNFANRRIRLEDIPNEAVWISELIT